MGKIGLPYLAKVRLVVCLVKDNFVLNRFHFVLLPYFVDALVDLPIFENFVASLFVITVFFTALLASFFVSVQVVKFQSQ